MKHLNYSNSKSEKASFVLDKLSFYEFQKKKSKN